MAAEEYIAHIAQRGVPKPSWWKEFLNKIRMWWNGTGWGKKYPVTTDQIEVLLARSSRKMRKHWYNRRSEVLIGKNGSSSAPIGAMEDGQGTDLRFAVNEVKKLDHSQYQENTMLSGDEDIELVFVENNFKTIREVEKELSDKIKNASGRLEIINEDQNMNILIQFNDSFDKAFSEKAVNETLSDGTSANVHAVALLNIEELLRKAKLGASHRDWHVYAKNYVRGTQKEPALQIHRFYTAMQYGDDIYGVKMTVREKRSGATVFYTLETHELDIQKIDPEAESFRGGVVKAALPGRSPVIKYNSFFEKFKPIDDLLGLKYKEKYKAVRFSVEEYSEEDHRDIVAILQPFVGQVVDQKESEYRKYLLEHGVDIPEDDAKAFAVEAMRANQKIARQRGIRKRDNWLYENYPLFRMVAEVAGDNFMINPEYTSSEGEHFTGSWIAPEFVKYSGPPKKFEEFSSAKLYQAYLARREKALKHAKGTDLSDIAEAISRKTGRDSLTLKEEIKDFFRDLKKKEFYGRYAEWKKNQAFEDRALRDAIDKYEKGQLIRVIFLKINDIRFAFFENDDILR